MNEGAFLTGMTKIVLNTDYTDVVSKVGGLPVIIPPTNTPDEMEIYTDLCDGFIFTGGRDIAPIIYGEVPHPACGPFDLAVDRCTIQLILLAIQKNKPILGICRGMQLINVALGGSLHQDIPSQFKNTSGHDNGLFRSEPSHTVEIIDHTTPLYKILNKDTLEVNSFHHQAVCRLGKGVNVCASAPDGIVEAFTVDEYNILAVQWHPEMMAFENNNMLCLFESFIKQCKNKEKV